MAEKSLKFGKIYSLFYVILVGAIGSGLWDLFLKDLLFWVGDLFVYIASSIYKGYFDRLYEDVGKQFDALLYLPGLALISVILMSPLVMFSYISIRLRRTEMSLDNDEENENPEISKTEHFISNQFENHRFRFKLILIFPMFLISIIFLDLLISSASSNSAVMVVERRLEIIRPYISDNLSYKIASDFRLVDSRLKLQNLIKAIEDVANENNIVLPEIKLYGIESSNKRDN
ncbi:MAG: hypothetical protein V7771_10725 [Shewanella psychromarinicola]|uniref:hypothetical protein n=1 Tax=Shewanella psychromarinicola TaxID=2487742 RepID=UPI003002E860